MRSELLPSSAAMVSTDSLLLNVHRRTALFRPPIAIRHRRRLGGVRQGAGYSGGDQPVYRRLGQPGGEDSGKGAVVRRVEHHRRPIITSNRRDDISYVFERRPKRELFGVDDPDRIGRLRPDAR